MRKSVRKDRTMNYAAGIAERFAESVRPALGRHAYKELARMVGVSQRRSEQLLSPSEPRPPTAEQIATVGKVFGEGWVRYVLFGGDEDGARARLEARRQALLHQLAEIEQKIGS